jgi:DNA-binding FrmR family transcriptional regulator
MKSTINRLRRLRGQIERIEAEIARDRSCHEVVPQLLAAKGALDATVRAYLADALASCDEGTKRADMERLIKLLLKNV